MTGQLSGRHAGIVFVADDLAAWLISILADAGRRRLATLGLGNEQERALRSAATAAVQRTAAELRPGDEERAEQLAMVVSQVFGEPVPGDLLAGRATMLEALQVGVAGQLAVLDDAGLTGTGQSSADVLGVPGAVVAQKLTMHLLQEIMSRGPRGGPLEPLSNQLNHDKSHLQGLRVEGMVDRLDDKLVEVLARMGSTRAVAAVPTALAQLPAATPGFTGRDDELTLLAGLLDSAGPSGPVMVSAVAGMAGVGKTALAVQAGHAARKRGWFSGGVLFIDLHGYDQVPVEPGQALEALLRALRVPDEHIPPTVEERAGLYRSVLARMNDPVLVIADNASFEAQVRPLLPGAGPHKVLVTSRQTLANVGARLVDVTVLNDQAAVDLLDTALHAARADDDRISGDQQGADRLAGLCDGLPLALQIVGALLKGDPALSTSELADQLADETERLPTLRYDDGSGMAGPSVAAAFELSYHRLEEIVARVFRLLPVSPGPDFSNEVAAVLADLPTSRVRRLLVGLAAAHLIEAAPGRPGRWRMHDLVRLYAQQLSGEHAEADRREQAWDRLFAYYMDRVSAADDHLRALPGIDGPDVFTGREAALAWLDSERASLVAAVAIASDIGRDQAALHLPIRLAEYFLWRRRFDDWITATTTSLDTARRLRDRSNEGVALINLGNALMHVRRFEEAITACQDAVAIYRQIGDRHGEGRALNNLGLVLQGVRRFAEAITAHQNAVAIYRDTSDRHRKGMALNNLGLALREMRRFEEAIATHQEAAAIYRETGDRHHEGTAFANLGNVLRHAGRFEEAYTACQDAVAIFRETGDRHGEGAALGNLGGVLGELGRFDEAITAAQDAVAIYREIDDRHSEGLTLGNLGLALMELGRLEEAITALQDAAAIYRETNDRHGEGLTLGNLGVALRELGRFEEAIAASQNAAAIYRETDDRHGEGVALEGLGRTLHEVRRLGEAMTAYQDAIAIYGEAGDQKRQAIARESLERARAARQA